jgi:hypothetical protein
MIQGLPQSGQEKLKKDMQYRDSRSLSKLDAECEDKDVEKKGPISVTPVSWKDPSSKKKERQIIARAHSINTEQPQETPCIISTVISKSLPLNSLQALPNHLPVTIAYCQGIARLDALQSQPSF